MTEKKKGDKDKHQYIPFKHCIKCDGNVNANWIDKEGICIYCKWNGPHD